MPLPRKPQKKINARRFAKIPKQYLVAIVHINKIGKRIQKLEVFIQLNSDKIKSLERDIVEETGRLTERLRRGGVTEEKDLRSTVSNNPQIVKWKINMGKTKKLVSQELRELAFKVKKLEKLKSELPEDLRKGLGL